MIVILPALKNAFNFIFFVYAAFRLLGVGGIESEAVMLGQPLSLTLPQVVGCKLLGTINPLTTSIDIVLGITKVTLPFFYRRCHSDGTKSIYLGLEVCSNMLYFVFFFFQHLRQAGIAGRFVEFFGPGVSQLSAPDRTTIANMCPEYNATVSFFPVDQVTLKHFKKTSE